MTEEEREMSSDSMPEESAEDAVKETSDISDHKRNKNKENKDKEKDKKIARLEGELAECQKEIKKRDEVLIEAQNNFKNVSDIRSLFELTLLRMASADSPAPAPKAVKKPTPAPAPAPKVEEPKAVESEPEPEPEPAPAEPVVEESSPLFDFINENKYSPAPKKTAEVPDWLVSKEEPEEPAPAPAPKAEEPAKEDKIIRSTSIDTSKISHYEISTTGTNFVLSDEQIFNISVLADKQERLSLISTRTKRRKPTSSTTKPPCPIWLKPCLDVGCSFMPLIQTAALPSAPTTMRRSRWGRSQTRKTLS